MKFEISQELANDVLRYLAKQPYEYVFHLIQQLQQIKAIQPADAVPTDIKSSKET